MHIEVDPALQRLAGNKALYLRLAQSFPDEVATISSSFRSHLAAGRTSEAAAVLHGLKGVASTIGACELAQLAGQMDMLLKRGVGGPETVSVESRCLALEACIARTLTALDESLAELRLAPQSPSSSTGFDAGGGAVELKAMLAELMPLLESHNMRAVSLFARLQYRFGAVSSLQSSARLGALADAMNTLDFASALENCRLLDAEVSP